MIEVWRQVFHFSKLVRATLCQAYKPATSNFTKKWILQRVFFRDLNYIIQYIYFS